jgi:hypothetical protein
MMDEPRISIGEAFRIATQNPRTPEEEAKWQAEKDLPLVEYYKHSHPRMWVFEKDRQGNDVNKGIQLRACDEKGDVYEWRK